MSTAFDSVCKERDKFKAQRDELLAAAKESIALADETCLFSDDGEPIRTEECAAVYDRVKASIAKAEGHSFSPSSPHTLSIEELDEP